MDENARLREAVKYAMEELDKFADFMGAEGYFTYAKEIKIMVLPKLQDALSPVTNGDQG